MSRYEVSIASSFSGGIYVKEIEPASLSVEEYPSRLKIVIHFLQVMDKTVNNIWKTVTISHSDVIGSFEKNLHKKPFRIFVGSSDFNPKEYDQKTHAINKAVIC